MNLYILYGNIARKLFWIKHYDKKKKIRMSVDLIFLFSEYFYYDELCILC